VLKFFSEKWNEHQFDISVDTFNYDLGTTELFIRDIKNNPVKIFELEIKVQLTRMLFWTYFSDLPSSKAVENVTTQKIEMILSETDFQEESLNLNFIKDINSLPLEMNTVLKVLAKPTLTFNSAGMKATFTRIA